MRLCRIIILLAILVILVLVFGFLFTQGFFGPKKSAEPSTVLPTPTPVDMVDVVVVTQHINRGQILDEAVLSLTPLPRSSFLEGMFTSVDQVVGKRARIDMESGYIITQNMLADTTDQLTKVGSDAALLIPKGLVAVSIPISRITSVSYAPQRGDHVSVIVSLLFVDLDSDFQSRLPNNSAAVLAAGNSVLVGPAQEATEQAGNLSSSEQITTLGAQVVTGSNISPMGRAQVDPAFEQLFYLVPSEKQRTRLVSQTLIRDVIVLQVGNFAQPTIEVAPPPLEVQPGEPTPTPAPEAVVEEVPPPPDVITLIVSPQDAVTLNYLMYAGAQLTLALRSAGDDTNTPTEAVTLQYLLSTYNIPVPVKLPYGMEPRVDELNAPLLPNDVPTPTPEP